MLQDLLIGRAGETHHAGDADDNLEMTTALASRRSCRVCGGAGVYGDAATVHTCG